MKGIRGVLGVLGVLGRRFGLGVEGGGEPLLDEEGKPFMMWKRGGEYSRVDYEYVYKWIMEVFRAFRVKKVRIIMNLT